MKLGCNYWASNAGTEMWRQFDVEVIREDIRVLSSYGVEYLRVFPNWRDFQPVEPLYESRAMFAEYRMSNGDFPTNKYFLDEEMLARFEKFCDVCDEYGVKLIVGLITGWMSGRTFIPVALYDKNLYLDPICQHFEQLFVGGFVKRFKNRSTIYAWNHGNEVDCLGEVGSKFASESWARMISNAILANDDSRPIICGAHSLSLNGYWTIKGQADTCDVLVTHPYAARIIKELEGILSQIFAKEGFEIEVLDISYPYIVSADNEMIRSLKKTFEEYTGQKGETYVNAGGTYARYLPCAAEIGVSIGGGLPDCVPKGHGGVHQPDECISIKGFLSAIELITHMLIECDKELNK